MFCCKNIQRAKLHKIFNTEKFSHVKNFHYLCSRKKWIEIMFLEDEENRSVDEILKEAQFPDDYDAFKDEELEMIP